MIVADASVLAAALIDEGAPGALARERLLADAVGVPELADVEVLSVLRRQVLGGRLTATRGGVALQDYTDLALDRYPHLVLLAGAWRVRDNVSAYHAQYVALAELLDVTLLTADGRLARAPRLPCRVDLLR